MHAKLLICIMDIGESVMTLAGIIVLGVGVLVVGIGLIFIIPYKNVKRFTGNNMVWNAAMYNEPLDEAANV